jgi:hypothetical protein
MKKEDKTAIHQNEFQEFINESFINRSAPHKWVRIGIINNDAKKRIEQKCGVEVSEIHIDNYGVIHALKKKKLYIIIINNAG